jgi:hypothetical protein
MRVNATADDRARLAELYIKRHGGLNVDDILTIYFGGLDGVLTALCTDWTVSVVETVQKQEHEKELADYTAKYNKIAAELVTIRDIKTGEVLRTVSGADEREVLALQLQHYGLPGTPPSYGFSRSRRCITMDDLRAAVRKQEPPVHIPLPSNTAREAKVEYAKKFYSFLIDGTPASRAAKLTFDRMKLEDVAGERPTVNTMRDWATRPQKFAMQLPEYLAWDADRKR